MLQAALNQLIGRFIETHGDFGLERIDGEEADYDRLREALESLPFLADKKMVVLRTPSANKDFVQRAESLLRNTPESTDVILIEPKLDKRSSYYKYVSKATTYQSYDELHESGLARWLTELAATEGGTITQADARYLVHRVGAQQQLLGNELKKLVLYQPTISRKAIDLLVEQTPQSTVFELIEAAFSGDAQKMVRLYDEQRRLKVEPQQILGLIGWQLHTMAVIKAAGARSADDIARTAKINPYVVRKNTPLVRRITLQGLRDLIAEALRLDVRLKSESIDADEATRHFLLQIALVATG